MEEDFLMDFNVTDTPVFARKSAPPSADDTIDRNEMSVGFTGASVSPTVSTVSTPSSSLLDSTKSFNPTPLPTTHDDPPDPAKGVKNNMEVDSDNDDIINDGISFPLNFEENEDPNGRKKARSRSRSKKAMKKMPRIPKPRIRRAAPTTSRSTLQPTPSSPYFWPAASTATSSTADST